MSERIDRKAELERKKARLAQIRAEKQSKAARKEVGNLLAGQCSFVFCSCWLINFFVE